MRENTAVTEEIQNNKGLTRRTVVKGAAWSVPVIAAAVATPLAAASAAGADLVPTLSGPLTLSLTALGLPVATVSTPTTLTISNLTAAPSTAGNTVNVVYPSSLLTLNITGAGISLLGSDGNYTITLPSIPASGSLTIQLGTLLDSALNVGVLTGLLGGPTPQMVATVAGDAVDSNNTTAADMGITIL